MLQCVMLQASKADLLEIEDAAIDASVPIITLIFDMTTDHLHFHFCKEGAACSEEDLRAVAGDDDTPKNVLEFAALLGRRRAKDPVPLNVMAGHIARLGKRCQTLGKTLHLLLTGCNTVNLVLPICEKLDSLCPAAKCCVWVLATNSVWPGDMSPFLWAQYGFTVTEDLAAYRVATRILLDEFNVHWQRQKMVDESLAEKNLQQTLCERVMLDRLDRVVNEAGFATMASL